MTGAPKRIQLRRTKGWRKPEGAIVVARPSRWGNPYHVDEFGLDLSLRLFSNTVQGIFAPGLLEHYGDADFRRVLDRHRLF